MRGTSVIGSQVPTNAPGDSRLGVPDRIPGAVRVPGGHLNRRVTEWLPDHRQALAQSQPSLDLLLPEIVVFFGVAFHHAYVLPPQCRPAAGRTSRHRRTFGLAAADRAMFQAPSGGFMLSRTWPIRSTSLFRSVLECDRQPVPPLFHAQCRRGAFRPTFADKRAPVRSKQRAWSRFPASRALLQRRPKPRHEPRQLHGRPA